MSDPANPISLPVEGIDFYREGPYTVFTAHYLLRRGYCCESGCRHCPFGFGPDGRKRRLEAENTKLTSNSN